MKLNKIIYTGTNEDEIMKIIPISVSLTGAVKIGDFAIFKDDIISIEKDGIYVEKPAYVGTGKHKIEM